MQDRMTNHIITIDYTSRCEHTTSQPRAQVMAAGDGGIDHWLETVRAAMVAAGFSTATARRVVLLEAVDE